MTSSDPVTSFDSASVDLLFTREVEVPEASRAARRLDLLGPSPALIVEDIRDGRVGMFLAH